jgi:predicted dithiol-disulfide oxidoreductase (DUF899 family)
MMRSKAEVYVSNMHKNGIADSERVAGTGGLAAVAVRKFGVKRRVDRAPKGRNEAGIWWRRHDRYGR